MLWARRALIAVLEARTAEERGGAHRTGTWVDGEGLHLDDAGCTWWGFARRSAGWYVLPRVGRAECLVAGPGSAEQDRPAMLRALEAAGLHRS